VTPVHNAALDEHGPCSEHRFSYVNVARRVPGDPRVPVRTLVRVDGDETVDVGAVADPVAEEVLVG